MLSGVVVYQAFQSKWDWDKEVNYFIFHFQVGLHFSCQRLVKVELGHPGPT